MTKFYFIRHGKTQWNLESRYQGANGDSPLLPQSYEEIKLLAKSLKKVAIAHIFSSPLPRAKTTAEKLKVALDRDIPLTIDPRLAEFNLGKMEGMKFADVAAKWPDVLDAFRHHPDRYDPQVVDSESFPSVIQRLGDAVRDYAQQYPHGNVVVVSHGAALNAAINGLLGAPLAHLKDRGGLSNTSTTILQTDDGQKFELVKWNDTSYLHKDHVDPTDTIWEGRNLMDNEEAKKKQSEQLVHRLVKAIDADPDKFNNYYDLGSLLTRLHDYVQAEELFQKALGIFEKKGDQKAINLLKYGLGNVYYSVGKVDEAIKYYNQIDDDRLKADSYLMLAQSYMKKKQYKQAVAYGLTAYELRSEDPEVNQVLGDSMLALGEFKHAQQYYDQILLHHPGRADTQFNRGLVAMALGQPYKKYLAQAKQLDLDYYQKSEKRISDIEHALRKMQKND